MINRKKQYGGNKEEFLKAKTNVKKLMNKHETELKKKFPGIDKAFNKVTYKYFMKIYDFIQQHPIQKGGRIPLRPLIDPPGKRRDVDNERELNEGILEPALVHATLDDVIRADAIRMDAIRENLAHQQLELQNAYVRVLMVAIIGVYYLIYRNERTFDASHFPYPDADDLMVGFFTSLLGFVPRYIRYLTSNENTWEEFILLIRNFFNNDDQEGAGRRRTYKKKRRKRKTRRKTRRKRKRRKKRTRRR